MKIKSLLIGSAAAMAVTGAQAADIITVPEPEPVEYVRVCDVYGAGFFYIPGTETCLKISGYVWYQMGASSADTIVWDPDANNGNGAFVETNGWRKNSRARLNIDARSETEWGTLRGYIRLQGHWNAVSNGVGIDGVAIPGLGGFGIPGITFGRSTTDGPVYVDQAWITLGGFMAGYSESFFVDSKNGGPSNYGSHSWTGLSYGYQQRQLIGYRFDGGNGFFGAVSLEDDEGDGTFAVHDYMPDVVGKIGVAQGWGALWGVVAYDESQEEIGAQVGLHLNVPNTPGSSLRVLGYYAGEANAYSVGSRWSILASYYHQFTPTFGASVGAQYFKDLDYGIPGSPDGWQAELSTVWTPVHNFEVRAELNYFDSDLQDEGVTSGYLRFTRYFGD